MQPVANAKIACPKCGAHNLEVARFCHQCGGPLDKRADRRYVGPTLSVRRWGANARGLADRAGGRGVRL